MKALLELHGRKIEAQKRSGFTLLELLVAMTVLSVLIVMLMAMVDSASKLWKANESRVESYREARAALNLIVKDLQSVYSSTNTNYFRSTVADLTQGASTNDSALFFISAMSASAQDTSSKSDLCEVGYYLKYGKTTLSSAKQEAFSLYRFFRESDSTFNDITNQANFFVGASSSNNEVLARNIPNFKVNFYYLTNGGIQTWTRSPVIAGKPVPDFVEVQITAFNNEAAKRLINSSDWKDTNSRIYQENFRTFTARVPVRQPQ